MGDHKQTPEAENTTFGAPHVVLLGAGASKAALPNGDMNGNEIPLMRDLVRVCKLGEIDPIAEKTDDFEAYFSDLRNEDIKQKIAARIRDYFSSLSLPDEATLYDYLVLSLREKDVIATFNWDPFLYQACYRNHKVAKMPYIIYLHGSVAVGYCMEDKIMGLVGYPCSKCRKPFPPPKLLYPVKQKDYNSDPVLKAEWSIIKKVLSRAYVFTIFGYSAPDTDVEAKKLLKEGWGDIKDRSLEEVEIINTRPKDELITRWDQFIHTHHFRTTPDFFDSWTIKHPRRTCEAMFEMLMQVTPYPDNPPPITKNLSELQDWFKRSLISHEKKQV